MNFFQDKKLKDIADLRSLAAARLWGNGGAGREERLAMPKRVAFWGELDGIFLKRAILLPQLLLQYLYTVHTHYVY